MQRPPVVSVVSPNGLIREGLARVLEGQGCIIGQLVGKPQDLDQTMSVVLIEASEAMDVAAAVIHVRHSHPDARIAVIGARDRDMAVDALAVGADQFINQTIDPDALGILIRLLDKGLRLADLQDHVFGNDEADSSAVSEILSKREIEVLQKLVEGLSDDQISAQLGIVSGTVKLHVKSIFRKLNTKNRTQAAIWAYAHGLKPGNTRK